MSRKNNDEFDWAKSIYNLAVDRSTTLDGMAEAANLNPQAGDVSDMDLSELDLSGQDLSGWDLSEANLEGTVLRGTRLRGAKIDPHRLLKANHWKEAELDEELRQKVLKLEVVEDALIEFDVNLVRKIDDFELSVKTNKALKRDNLVYAGDLVQKSEAELLRVPNLGRQSLNEIKDFLASIGLHLQMEVPNWPPENIEELAESAAKEPILPLRRYKPGDAG